MKSFLTTILYTVLGIILVSTFIIVDKVAYVIPEISTIQMCVFAYLLGSVLFGVILAKCCNLGDLRDKGSGNIGATNIARVSGKKFLGILTAFLDGLKCAVPVLIAKNLELYSVSFGVDITMNNYQLSNPIIMIVGVMAVLGHIFPIWHKFKGGKGIASFIGMSLALDYRIGLIALTAWLITFITTKISSLSSIIMILTSSIVYIIHHTLSESWPVILLSALIIFKHQENIVRIIKGQEKKLKI